MKVISYPTFRGGVDPVGTCPSPANGAVARYEENLPAQTRWECVADRSMVGTAPRVSARPNAFLTWTFET